MGRPVDRCLVPESGTIRDAMAALDRGASQIALAVDPSGRLAGVVTDGDVRRALLRGAALDDALAPHLTRRPETVTSAAERSDVLELMQARRIDAIPVLDDGGHPIALHLLGEYLAPVRRDNWAVVMAGGEGRRLLPLTELTPKPMLKVAGRPILERIVLQLAGHGIRRVFIALGYRGEVIEEHFGDGSRFGCRIDYLREETALGTAGALGLLPEPPTAPLLVMNGDLVTQANLSGLLDAHAASLAAATVGTRRYVIEVPFGVVERSDDAIVSIVEKPRVVHEVLAGIYVVSPELVSRVDGAQRLEVPELLADALARGDVIASYQIEDDWIDVGRGDDLARARDGGEG
jgi:dTDP-glucose pyrophosphorylase